MNGCLIPRCLGMRKGIAKMISLQSAKVGDIVCELNTGAVGRALKCIKWSFYGQLAGEHVEIVIRCGFEVLLGGGRGG
jgi:hypothetical protein